MSFDLGCPKTIGDRPVLRRAMAMAAAFATIAGAAQLLAADPSGTRAGDVRFVKIANSAFDKYTKAPTPAQQSWMREHYARMLVYTPYFDRRLSWFPGGWVYKDLYAIYPETPLATARPDWILRDAEGTRLYIRYECARGRCTQYAADIGNPAFRKNWIGEASVALAKGYRGIMVDDVNMLISRVSNGEGQSIAPQDPRTGTTMTEADWRRYMAEFVEEIRAAFPQKEIVHNALWFSPQADPYVRRQYLAADVILLERGVNDSGIVKGTGTYGFETMLGLIDWLHENGRAVWLDGEATTDRGREYGLAAYFLVGGGMDYVGQSPGGEPDNWWAGYDVRLGAALGPRTRENGVFRREFERGLVLVNQPGAAQATVTLDAPYMDLAGASRTSVSLGPAEGVVLRRTPAHHQ